MFLAYKSEKQQGSCGLYRFAMCTVGCLECPVFPCKMGG